MFREIEMLIRESRWEAALAKCRELLANCPGQPRLHGYEGYCLYQLARYGEAKVSLRRAIALDEKFFGAGLLLAHALDRLHEYEEALEVADQMLAIRPSHVKLKLFRDGLRNSVPNRITDSWELSKHLDHYEVELTQHE